MKNVLPSALMAIHVIFLPLYPWPAKAENTENRSGFRLPVTVEKNINILNFYMLFGQLETLTWFFEQGTTRTTELNSRQLTEKTH